MKRSFLSKEQKTLLQSRETIVWTQIALTVSVLLFAFTGCQNSTALNNFSQQQLTTIQLCDATTIDAKQRFSLDRSPAIIQSFAQEWITLTWSANGMIPDTKTDRGKPVKDKGVKTANGRKVPYLAWAGSLMMNSDYAVRFLNELANPEDEKEKIPSGVFTGQITTSVKTRYVSRPRVVKPGIWDVDTISDRILFDEYNQQQLKPIPFNRTLRIRAVTISHSPLKEKANALEKALYAMQAKGLEIETLFDYTP